MKNDIYLDSASTTKVSSKAVEAMVDVMTKGYGNPSSNHPLGKEAAKRLESDRLVVATALGCQGKEVIFTSGGTEGNNLAITVALTQGKRVGKHIITSAIEHSSVLEPLNTLVQQGYEVTFLKPNKEGRISTEQVEDALREDTILVSLMLVNNELGTVQDISAIGNILKGKGSSALLHTDAVQGFLKVPFAPKDLGAHLVTISGHKVHAPKGVGALYVREGLRVPPMIAGGGQEEGRRSGTQGTPQIAAFATACQEGVGDIAFMSHCKKDFLETLTETIPSAEILSEGDAPHICAIALPGYPSEVLVRELGDRGIYVSSGSACHRGKGSHVFASLGRKKSTTMGALRISFSSENQPEDGKRLVLALKEILATRVGVM